MNMNGTQALDGRPKAKTGHGIFGKGSVKAAFQAELLHQSTRAAENAFVIWNANAVGKYAGIALHLLTHRLCECFAVADFPHAYTCRRSSPSSANGACPASSMLRAIWRSIASSRF